MIILKPNTFKETLEKRSSVSNFSISQFSFQGSASVSLNSSHILSGIIGQADVAVSSNGSFTIRGGFLIPSNNQQIIFSNGFESGNTSQWSVIQNLLF